MTADLVAFLHARLQDDERIARAAAKETDRDWDASVDPDPRYTYRAFLAGDNDPFAEVSFFHGWEVEAPNIMPHIARHDPARVLADVQAKRAILALHPTYKQEPYQAQVPGGWFHPPDPFHCACQSEDGIIFGHEPCDTKRLLASVYRDHPDFRPEWAPDV